MVILALLVVAVLYLVHIYKSCFQTDNVFSLLYLLAHEDVGWAWNIKIVLIYTLNRAVSKIECCYFKIPFKNTNTSFYLTSLWINMIA